MSRRQRWILVGGVVALMVLFMGALAVPGSALQETTVTGAARNREYLVAFIGLIMIGLMALGLDLRDWL